MSRQGADGTLLAIRDLIEAKGYAPSFREVAAETGYVISTIHVHVHELKDRGLIELAERHPRTLRLTSKGREATDNEQGSNA
jgi:SOS-response transcriptional repressor LexA